MQDQEDKQYRNLRQSTAIYSNLRQPIAIRGNLSAPVTLSSIITTGAITVRKEGRTSAYIDI
jgi:hypothetical protein